MFQELFKSWELDVIRKPEPIFAGLPSRWLFLASLQLQTTIHSLDLHRVPEFYLNLLFLSIWSYLSGHIWWNSCSHTSQQVWELIYGNLTHCYPHISGIWTSEHILKFAVFSILIFQTHCFLELEKWRKELLSIPKSHSMSMYWVLALCEVNANG